MISVAAIGMFAFAWWFGLYLVARNPRNPLLVWSGVGLVAYALGVLATATSSTLPALAAFGHRAQAALVLVPAVVWSGAAAYVLPEDAPLRPRLLAGWRFGLLPLLLIGLVLVATTDLIVQPAAGRLQPGPLHLPFVVLLLLPLFGGVVAVGRAARSARTRRTLALAAVVLLFFTLSIGLHASLLNLLPPLWMAAAIGVDLLLLDLAIVLLDAFAQGETLLPDISRSFAGALMSAILYCLPLVVAQVLIGLGGLFGPLLAATLAIVLALHVFADQLQATLDWLVLRNQRVREQRTEARAAIAALPRSDPDVDLRAMDDDDFVRLTRRALSQYGDLARLSASPLIYLPQISACVAANAGPLERAAELKRLLHAGIAQLKPQDDAAFGTSDEWRYYNALFFPYVAGLKPYSRRSFAPPDEPAVAQALEWLQTTVPERTLYNWQNSAARLVAQELRRGLPDRAA